MLLVHFKLSIDVLIVDLILLNVLFVLVSSDVLSIELFLESLVVLEKTNVEIVLTLVLGLPNGQLADLDVELVDLNGHPANLALQTLDFDVQ